VSEAEAGALVPARPRKNVDAEAQGGATVRSARPRSCAAPRPGPTHRGVRRPPTPHPSTSPPSR
jgi:hypothetical protein